MSDYKENALVVQSNQFIRKAMNDLTPNEIKIFDLFVSCIDTKNPKESIKMLKKEIMQSLNITETNYTYVDNAIKKLMDRKFVIRDEEKMTVGHYIYRFVWNFAEESTTIYFHPDVMPYLIDLKKNFLAYSISDLNALKSRYSMLMYKYLLSYIRQYKTTEITMKIDEIKDFLNVKDKYKDNRDFEKRILKTIETEINESGTLPFLIRYEKQRTGRKIDKIRFLIRARTSRNERQFMDIEKPLIYEERLNDLLKGTTPIEDIKNRQADMIIEEQNQ